MTRLQISALGNIGSCLGCLVLYLLLRLSGIFDLYKWTLILFLLISIIPILLLARYWRKDGAPVEIDELEERILMKSHLWAGRGAVWYFTVFVLIIYNQKTYEIIKHDQPAFLGSILLITALSQNLGILYFSAHPEAARVKLTWLDRLLFQRKRPESSSENHPGAGENR